VVGRQPPENLRRNSARRVPARQRRHAGRSRRESFPAIQRRKVRNWFLGWFLGLTATYPRSMFFLPPAVGPQETWSKGEPTRCLLAIFLCIAPLLMAQTPGANSTRVFITDSQSRSIGGGGGGANGAYGSTVASGARPQTAEIIKTFGQRCPQVVINNIQTKADYIVLRSRGPRSPL
jgi:hypothetical protein